MSTIEISKLRHSASHLLAMSVLSLYKDAKLGNCGVSEHGFYYDFAFVGAVGADALLGIQTRFQELVSLDIPMLSQIRSKVDLETYYSGQEQPYKLEVLNDLKAKRADTIVFGENLFVDVRVSGVVNSTKVLSNTVITDISGAYWKGDDKRPMLTRISGACFATAEEMQEYIEYRAELQRRDHRVLGKKIGYFSVSPEFGTGLIFWHQRGAFVKHALTERVVESLVKLRAEIVESPLFGEISQIESPIHPSTQQFVVFNPSDDPNKHFALRQEMFSAHLSMFQKKERSYRDLPWKVAEIGKLARFEKGNELEGLNKSREFTQDNVTVLCSKEQIEYETEQLIVQAVTLLRELGLSVFEISFNTPNADTKNEKQDYLFLSGLIKGLARKLTLSIIENVAAQVKEPEITIRVKDSLKQFHELTKIQFLFTIPLEKQLTYVGKNSESHIPVLLRATLTGSLERLIATLIEQYAGTLPLWLMQEQVRILPVTNKQELYSERIQKQLVEAGIRTTVDASPDPLEGRIKQAEEDKVPYMLVIGEKEQGTNAASVRLQGHGDLGLISLETFTNKIQQEIITKSIKSILI